MNNELPCGCRVGMSEHDGACRRIHLMETIKGPWGNTSVLPLCRMDAYKVNREAKVFRGQSGAIYMNDYNTPLGEVCNVCLEVATR